MDRLFERNSFIKYNLTPISPIRIVEEEMSLSEHIEEFSQRFFFSFVISIFIVVYFFLQLDSLVLFFKEPAIGVKFLQFVPGEYVLTSVKIVLCCGLFTSVPFTLYQISLYVSPGLTEEEKKILVPTLIGSLVLFTLGLFFSYRLILPTALQFFINYGSEIIEPFWSFDQYFNFSSTLILTTGVAFLLPILQLVLGISGIITIKQMIAACKYVLVLTTILSAIITPSTDPFTQLLLASALFFLYLVGTGLVWFFCR
jgi:sec-independent protein translocase protein TatC